MYIFQAGNEFSLPSKDVINELAQSSAGDIRTAINALQFSCQRGIQGTYQTMSTMPLGSLCIKAIRGLLFHPLKSINIRRSVHVNNITSSVQISL